MPTQKQADSNLTEYLPDVDYDELLDDLDELLDFSSEAPVFIDMSEHTNISGKALRVELRQTRGLVVRRKVPAPKAVDDNYIIGIIDENSLPQEGKEFRMPYHNLNALTDFGSVKSQDPVRNVYREDNCFYFTTNEGDWRLKILDAGN